MVRFRFGFQVFSIKLIKSLNYQIMYYFYRFIFFTSIVLFLSCNNVTRNMAQSGTSITEKIVTEIQFTNTDFRDNSIEEIFLDQFNLNQDKFLNMHFKLDQSLVSALRKLDSSMSDEELVANGNFQFSFFIDNNLIYSQDLHPGAGLPEDKMNRLNYRVPLLYPERIDYWGWYMWLRFMKMGGGEDALESGKHQLRLEARTYLSGEENKVGTLIAAGEVEIDVKEIPIDVNEVVVQKIATNSGWEISEELYDVAKIEMLNKKIAQKRFLDINGIVVLKNEKLIIEEYFNGANRETLHNPRSVGKTIASTMMGIAIEEGHLASEDIKLSSFYDLSEFENYDPIKEEVTLKDLMTMSSSFLGNDDDYDSPGNEEYMYPTDDWVKFTLDLPVNKSKTAGKDFEYFTAGIVVLGDVVHQSVPGGLVAYTDEKFFKPLGIDKRNWQYTPQNIGNTAGGLQLRAVDFAKWGQVYKNNGRWKGEQLIPKAWVEKSLDHQVQQEYVENGTYGYLFWNNLYTVDGKQYAYSSCSGNGGNKIYIFKDLPIVVAITASAYGMPFAHRQVDQMMERYILPAVLMTK